MIMEPPEDTSNAFICLFSNSHISKNDAFRGVLAHPLTLTLSGALGLAAEPYLYTVQDRGGVPSVI